MQIDDLVAVFMIFRENSGHLISNMNRLRKLNDGCIVLVDLEEHLNCFFTHLCFLKPDLSFQHLTVELHGILRGRKVTIHFVLYLMLCRVLIIFAFFFNYCRTILRF